MSDSCTCQIEFPATILYGDEPFVRRCEYCLSLESRLATAIHESVHYAEVCRGYKERIAELEQENKRLQDLIVKHGVVVIERTQWCVYCGSRTLPNTAISFEILSHRSDCEFDKLQSVGSP